MRLHVVKFKPVELAFHNLLDIVKPETVQKWDPIKTAFHQWCYRPVAYFPAEQHQVETPCSCKSSVFHSPWPAQMKGKGKGKGNVKNDFELQMRILQAGNALTSWRFPPVTYLTYLSYSWPKIDGNIYILITKPCSLQTWPRVPYSAVVFRYRSG